MNPYYQSDPTRSRARFVGGRKSSVKKKSKWPNRFGKILLVLSIITLLLMVVLEMSGESENTPYINTQFRGQVIVSTELNNPSHKICLFRLEDSTTVSTFGGTCIGIEPGNVISGTGNLSKLTTGEWVIISTDVLKVF